MKSGFRLFAASAIVTSLALILQADGPSSQSTEVHLQLANLLFSEGRYTESLEAYRDATNQKIGII